MAETQAKSINIVSLHADRLACSECGLRKVCIPAGLSREDMHEFEQIVHRSRPILAGEIVFREGDPFSSIAAVHYGCFKSYMHYENGSEYVLGFHHPGELLGLDAIYTTNHVCDVVALKTSSICDLNYKEVTKFAAYMPDLQSQLFRMMSGRICALNIAAANYTVDQRMAAFLLTLSLQFKLGGYSERSFSLAMSREEVGNHLRMATETASRVLSKFQEQGLIRINRRLVEIFKHDGLQVVAGSAFFMIPGSGFD